MHNQRDDLKVIIFANTGLEIVKPLFEAGINIVGLIESYDTETISNPLKRLLTSINRRIKGLPPAQSLREFAAEHSIPYITYADKEKSYVASWMKEKESDLLLSHQAQILPKSIFSVPSYGAINLHPTLLPKYRGPNPFFWMYYYKDMTAGITIHKIDENIDTGEIITQRKQQIEHGTDADKLERSMVKDLAVPALIDLLESYDASLETAIQPSNSPTPYAKVIPDEEYRKLVLSSSFSLKEFWHLLHANSQWQSALLGKDFDSAFDWEISNYQQQAHELPIGTVERKKNVFCIAHPEGFVYIKKKFNLNRFVVAKVFN